MKKKHYNPVLSQSKVSLTMTTTLMIFFLLPFYFLLPISIESIVFGSNFRSGDFDGFTLFEVP